MIAVDGCVVDPRAAEIAIELVDGRASKAVVVRKCFRVRSGHLVERAGGRESMVVRLRGIRKVRDQRAEQLLRCLYIPGSEICLGEKRGPLASTRLRIGAPMTRSWLL